MDVFIILVEVKIEYIDISVFLEEILGESLIRLGELY